MGVRGRATMGDWKNATISEDGKEKSNEAYLVRKVIPVPLLLCNGAAEIIAVVEHRGKGDIRM